MNVSYEEIKRFYSKCKQVKVSVFYVLFRYFIHRLYNKNIMASNNVFIYGLNNIYTSGLLQIGMNYVGFMHREDKSLLNIKGKINFKGKFVIGKGTRFDIGERAVAEFGSGYVTANTAFIIMHGITVGEGCAISWGCQFLDEDFHQLQYENKKTNEDNKIYIGSHVWIGSNVTVLKGAVIPDGCVVASGSVVNKKFDKANVLIGGNPARVIKENITWE